MQQQPNMSLEEHDELMRMLAKMSGSDWHAMLKERFGVGDSRFDLNFGESSAKRL